MASVTVRQLRNEGGKVLQRVAQGETLTVTNDGQPIAELRPLQSPGLPAEELLRRWNRLPPIDVRAWARDMEQIFDSTL